MIASARAIAEKLGSANTLGRFIHLMRHSLAQPVDG